MTLVLIDAAGRLLGELPPFEVEAPWWQEVADFPPEFPVLRLLHGDRPAPPGGHVTYLAEAAAEPRPAGLRPAQLRPGDAELLPHPNRAPYAEPGGPAASVAWAREHLPGVTAHQQRTWNLSAIWRLDSGGAPAAWLKQVPAFFAHEPTALTLVGRVAPGLVPRLLAAGPQGRMLLDHVPGEDRYGAGAQVCAAIAAAFHPVQAHFGGHLGELAAIPDGRPSAERYARIAAPHYATIPGLEMLVDELPRRLAAVAECGLPDTLVHGDLHPGNVRTGADGGLTIMDWGDCTVANPAFDILRLTGHLDDPAPLLDAWAYRWRQTVPGSEPLRAAELLRPVAALRAAATYAAFLDAIEPTERPYHEADVPAGLAAATIVVE